MVTLTNKSLPTPDIIRNLGLRFRDYRMRLMMISNILIAPIFIFADCVIFNNFDGGS